MWKLAWRNLWRYRGRTWIALLAIALSLGLFLMAAGMGDDSHRKMMDQAVRAAGGNVLIHGEGFWDHQTSDIYLTQADQVLENIENIPGIQSVVPRVLITGLVSSSHGDSGVRISGIDPEREIQIFDYTKYLAEGSFFSEDDNENDNEDSPLVLGSRIVEELEVELGDRIVIATTDLNGEMTRALFHLTGVINTESGMDDQIALTTLTAARNAIGYEDQTLSQIGIILHNDEDRTFVQETIQNSLQRADIEILRWDQAIPDMIGFIKIDDAFNYLINIMLFLVVGIGIANTFLMSVLKRVRELGLLMAMGLTPKQIGRLVMLETLILGLISVSLGFIIGFSMHLYLQKNGIDMNSFYGDEGVEMAGVALSDIIIRSTFNPVKWSVITGGIFSIVMISALYPAFRATRMDPASAMRTFM